MLTEIARIESALQFANPDDRIVWWRMGMALKSELGDEGFPVWNNWSKASASYKPSHALSVWKGIKSGGGVKIASLFYLARANGWRDNQPYREATPEQKARRNEVNLQVEQDRLSLESNEAIRSRALWERALPADPDHPYLVRKRVRPHGLRQQVNNLIVPLLDVDGVLWNVQRIFPDGQKLFRAGRARGLYSPIGDLTNPATLLVCEGWATGATLYEQSGYPVLCAMNAGNLSSVAQSARARWPEVDLVIAGDDDRQTAGNPGRTQASAAAQVSGARLCFPDFATDEIGSDFNDLQNLRTPA